MYKIGVIGDRDSVLGFMAVGFIVKTVIDEHEAIQALHNLVKEECAIIYLTEELAEKMTDEIDKYKDMTIPAIVLIPTKNGSTGLGMRNIRNSVERAVGADILFKSDDNS